MKKVLFATTALIATAGVASADITLTGDGRMGLVNTETNTNNDNDMTFDSRLRFTLTASGVTDGGLSFGGSARIDHYNTNTNDGTGGASAANGQAGSVYISGAFGKITMGDISDAAESAVGDVAGVGYTAGSVMVDNEMGYIGGTDDEGVAYSYSVNGLTVYASLGQRQAASADNQSSFGAAYTMNGITFAAGTTEHGNIDQTAFGVSGTFAGLGLKAVVLDNDNHGTVDGEFAVSATYAVDDSLTLTAFTRSVDNITGADDDFTGVGFAYNLGGGASLKGGYVSDGASRGYDQMDLGLNFSF